MLSLTDTEIAALKWVDDDRSNPRAGDIVEHAAAMRSVRKFGLTKSERRPGWTATVLTVAGRKALAKHTT